MADDLVFERAKPAEYNDVTYVASVHMRSWKNCYGKFIPEEHLNKDNRYNAFDFGDAYREITDNNGYEMRLAKSNNVPVDVAIFGPDPVRLQPRPKHSRHRRYTTS